MKKDNSAIDCVKFIFAILILLAHYASGWGHFPVLIDYCFSLYIVAVPFFFACSGFFMYRKVLTSADKNLIYISYIMRILKLYAAWSCIYISFQILDWIINGADIISVLQYFHKMIVYSTYPTIWFLPACVISAVMLWCLSKIGSINKVAVIAAFLYVIGSLGYSYSFLLQDTPFQHVLEIYNTLFCTTRNGVFNGFPWFFLGAWIATNEGKKSTLFYGSMAIIFLLATVLEAVFIKLKFDCQGVDTVFSLIPFIYCFFNLLLNMENISFQGGEMDERDEYINFCKSKNFSYGNTSIIT